MEQFVFVPVSVRNNKNLNSQSVTKQELAKYQADQSPKYQIDSLKKKINKKFIDKSDFSADKVLSCPRINLSKAQTLILDSVETGVLLTDFAQQRSRKNADVPDTYFTRRCWYISDSCSESKCHSQGDRKLVFLQNINVRSCKKCTHRVVVPMGLWTV